MPPAHNRLINLNDIAAGELFGKFKVGGVILGHDEAAAGVFVKTMNNAGPGHAANAAQLPGAMMEQRVDQGVFGMAGGGMNDQSGRLVERE